MSILDKLVERKDVCKYIDARIEKLLTLVTTNELTQFPPKKREYTKKIMVGRIRELRLLKGVINDRKEKVLASKYWEETRGDKGEQQEKKE